MQNLSKGNESSPASSGAESLYGTVMSAEEYFKREDARPFPREASAPTFGLSFQKPNPVRYATLLGDGSPSRSPYSDEEQHPLTVDAELMSDLTASIESTSRFEVELLRAETLASAARLLVGAYRNLRQVLDGYRQPADDPALGTECTLIPEPDYTVRETDIEPISTSESCDDEPITSPLTCEDVGCPCVDDAPISTSESQEETAKVLGATFAPAGKYDSLGVEPGPTMTGTIPYLPPLGPTQPLPTTPEAGTNVTIKVPSIAVRLFAEKWLKSQTRRKLNFLYVDQLMRLVKATPGMSKHIGIVRKPKLPSLSLLENYLSSNQAEFVRCGFEVTRHDHIPDESKDAFGNRVRSLAILKGFSIRRL